MFARSDSAVTPSEKSSIKTNRKSTTCFPMSLRWSSYVAPKHTKGGSITQNGGFSSEIAHRLKIVCYKVSLYENYQRQSCKAFIGLTIRAKIIGGEWPLLPEILGQTDRVGAKSPIFYLLYHSSVNTNRTNTITLHTFQWAQDEHRTLSLSLPKGAQKRRLFKIWTIGCDNSETVWDGCQLLLITNRKSHTGFRLVPTWITLNDLERRNSP